MQNFTTNGSISNNQFDFLEETIGTIDNILKHQILSFLNDPTMSVIPLLVINHVISNDHISKKVLYETQLLPKEELKKQKLVRQILQDKHEYTSDSVLVELIIKLLTGNSTQYTSFLAARIIMNCSFYPQEEFLTRLINDINTELKNVIVEIKRDIEKENFVEIVLEAFEQQNENVNFYKFEEKVSFPTAILCKQDLTTLGIYRLPLSKIERYD